MDQSLLIPVVWEFLSCRKKLTKACLQEQLLNDQLDTLYTRSHRANTATNRVFSYTLYMRIQTLEGLLEAYDAYCSKVSDRLLALAQYMEDMRRLQPHLGPLLNHLTASLNE